MIEAFFHARFFLEMAVKYGKELEFPPQMLPRVVKTQIKIRLDKRQVRCGEE